MIRLPTFSPIDFLVFRKFPSQTEIKKLATFGGAESREHAKKQLAEIESYEASLKALPPEQLNELLSEEQKKQRAEQQEREELEERKRLFNQPDAVADYAHWSKAAYWTLDEAIALSFGKAPEIVNWELVQKYLNVSAFALRYSRVRDLAGRAKLLGQLYNPVLPGFFLAWAKRNEIDVPVELVEKVKARGIVIGDWKDLYDKAKEKLDEAMLLLGQKEKKIAGLEQEREALNARANAVDSTAKPESNAEKPVTTRERNNVARIIAALSQAGQIDLSDPYKTARAIEALTEQNGTRVSDDTIAKWLKEAKEVSS
jgi:hypothetical protein